jgi:hypothetical protein
VDPGRVLAARVGVAAREMLEVPEPGASRKVECPDWVVLATAVEGMEGTEATRATEVTEATEQAPGVRRWFGCPWRDSASTRPR